MGHDYDSSDQAVHLCRQAIARGHDHPHAVRILARTWVFVIWHCRQSRMPYDPAQHRALQALVQPRHQLA